MDFLSPILREVSGAAELQRPIAELRNIESGHHALVVGNSTWRDGFDLDLWSGPVIGCNALYRDYLPDYLCAYDSAMIDELLRADLARVTRLVFRAAERAALVVTALRPNVRAGWYAADGAFPLFGLAGQMAITLAGWLGCSAITLLGFSCDESNVYAGSHNYVPREKWDKNALQPGGRRESVNKLHEAIVEYRRMVPGGMVDMIAPADWMLGALRASAEQSAA